MLYHGFVLLAVDDALKSSAYGCAIHTMQDTGCCTACSFVDSIHTACGVQRVSLLQMLSLLRMLMQGETLPDVAAVVFDEAHERSLDMDLALSLCLDLQQLGRPELRYLPYVPLP